VVRTVAVAEVAAAARPMGVVVTPGAQVVVCLGAAEGLMRTLPLGHAVEEKRLDLARSVLGVMVLLPTVVVAAAVLGLALGVVDVMVAMVARVRLVVRMVRVQLVDFVVRTVAVVMAHEVVRSGLGLALGVVDVVVAMVALVRLVVRMVGAVVGAEVVAVGAVVASKVAVRAVVAGEEALRQQLISSASCPPLAPQAGSLLREVYVAVPLGHELPAPLLGYIEALLVESLLQLLRGLFVFGCVVVVGLLVRTVGRFLRVLGGQEQM
jgi:hypothetical protein